MLAQWLGLLINTCRKPHLAGGFRTFFFHNIWYNLSHWLIFFTIVKKPPTRHVLRYDIKIFHHFPYFIFSNLTISETHYDITSIYCNSFHNHPYRGQLLSGARTAAAGRQSTRLMSNRLLCTHPKGLRESLPPRGFHGIPQAVGLRHRTTLRWRQHRDVGTLTDCWIG